MIYNHIMFIFQVLHDMIVILGATAIGVVGAFFVVSKIAYNVDEIENDSDNDDSKDFEQMYREDFNNLDIKELPSKEIIDTFVSSVDTPSGEVIITYNLDEKTFYYYTDRRNIPIRFLDISAQKFVVDHDCRAIYEEEELNDVFDESSVKEPFEENEQETYYQWLSNKFFSTTQSEETHKSIPDEEDSEHSEHSEHSHDEVESVFATYKTNAKQKREKRQEVEKIMNKYKFGGTMLDFNNKRESKNQEELEISFTKFKEMVKNKTE